MNLLFHFIISIFLSDYLPPFLPYFLVLVLFILVSFFVLFPSNVPFCIVLFCGCLFVCFPLFPFAAFLLTFLSKLGYFFLFFSLSLFFYQVTLLWCILSSCISGFFFFCYSFPLSVVFVSFAFHRLNFKRFWLLFILIACCFRLNYVCLRYFMVSSAN